MELVHLVNEFITINSVLALGGIGMVAIFFSIPLDNASIPQALVPPPLEEDTLTWEDPDKLLPFPMPMETE